MKLIKNSDPYKKWTSRRRMVTVVGLCIFMVGGISMLAQTVAQDFLPSVDGSVQTQAIVTNTVQRGSFQNPVFSVTLAYDVSYGDSVEAIRSGQRVPFEAYNALTENDVITVYYDPKDVYNWWLSPSLNDNTQDYYVVEFLLMVLGLSILAAPTVLRLALRMDDFDFNHDLNVTHG